MRRAVEAEEEQYFLWRLSGEGWPPNIRQFLLWSDHTGISENSLGASIIYNRAQLVARCALLIIWLAFMPVALSQPFEEPEMPEMWCTAKAPGFPQQTPGSSEVGKPAELPLPIEGVSCETTQHSELIFINTTTEVPCVKSKVKCSKLNLYQQSSRLP